MVSKVPSLPVDGGQRSMGMGRMMVPRGSALTPLGDPKGPNALKEMAWLPEQADEQIQLGFRIIQNAFENKVRTIEQENRSLQHANQEKTANIAGLQKKVQSLEMELIEAPQRSQQLAEEN